MKKKDDSKNWTLFLEYDSNNWTFFLENDAKNWTFFQKYDWKNWTFFFNMSQRIEYDSKNWAFFTWLKQLNLLLNMTQRLEPSSQKKWPLRIEPFFQHDSKNWTFFLHDSKNWTSSFKYDLRKYDSKNWQTFLAWLKELNLLFYVTQWIELLFSLTQRIEIFSWLKEFEPPFQQMTQIIETFFESKNWTFFQKYNSKNWTFFQHDSKNWNDSKDWTFFFGFNLTEKIVYIYIYIYLTWLKELNPFKKVTQRIEPSFWTCFNELNPFFYHDSKTWTLFSFRCDSKNWTLLLIWLKELNFLFHMTRRLDPFWYDLEELNLLKKDDSKNWTLFLIIWLKELNSFLIIWL